jgi:hypothetical protein
MSGNLPRWSTGLDCHVLVAMWKPRQGAVQRNCSGRPPPFLVSLGRVFVAESGIVRRTP